MDNKIINVNKENQENKEIAQILPLTEENFKLCGEYIKSGGIVGMPTETVYGLAANAFNIPAVRKIFEYKGRPLSDPLIVHVTSTNMAKDLINLDERSLFIFEKLAEKFWPGPLTIVSKANFNKISPILTANTEFIGIRYPNNKSAEKLINVSEVPLAAPSANKFCHVSPVNPKHVYEDFKEFPVYILDDGKCNYSMESTVIKLNINCNDNKIEILRKGAISKKQLEDFFIEFQKKYVNDNNINKYEVVFLNKNVKVPCKKEIKNQIENLEDNKNQEAPGQFIKHYSPNIETYIFDFYNNDCEENKNFEEKNLILELKDLADCILLDFKETIKSKFPEKTFLKIFDFSEKGEDKEVMQNIYKLLREAEKEEKAKFILICDINKYMDDENANKPTIVDRISKASSSRRILYK